MNQLIPVITAAHTHAVAAAAGERASYRFFELFTAQIRNPNTRTYARRAKEFFDWREARRDGEPRLEPHDAAR